MWGKAVTVAVEAISPKRASAWRQPRRSGAGADLIGGRKDLSSCGLPLSFPKKFEALPAGTAPYSRSEHWH